jgi:uncharacterized phage infection (PIP) family protein YhgE
MTVINKLKELASKALETADKLKSLSDQTGYNTTELQKWQYVADDLGVDLGTITDSLRRLTKSMSDARDGSSDAAKAYKKLGVSVTDANGELRDSNTVYGEAIMRSAKCPTRPNAMQ